MTSSSRPIDNNNNNNTRRDSLIVRIITRPYNYNFALRLIISRVKTENATLYLLHPLLCTGALSITTQSSSSYRKTHTYRSNCQYLPNWFIQLLLIEDGSSPHWTLLRCLTLKHLHFYEIIIELYKLIEMEWERN